MKNNKSLFEKRIDLSNCQINGGRLATTYHECSSATKSPHCSDTYTTTFDDNGKQTGSNMDFYDCSPC